MLKFVAFLAVAIFLISSHGSLASTSQSNGISQNSTTPSNAPPQNSTSIQTTKSIETYGNDSAVFAATISSNATWMKTNPTSLTVIVSSVDNLADIEAEIQEASCIVFINLAPNNGLYDVPTISIVSSTVFYDANNQTVNRINSAQTTYPTYWITVIKRGSCGSITNLMTSNDTSQVCQTIWAAAINTVTTDTPTQVLSQSQVSPMQQYQQATWLQMNPLLTYNYYYISSKDWLYSWHLISEANAYDSADAWEWWEVTSYIDHYLGDFVTNSFQDGPYVDNTYTQVDAASSAIVQTYGPTSTPDNKAITYSIGANFGENGVEFTAGASYTETNPGVVVQASGGPNSENWRDVYDGPTYLFPIGILWPYYIPAPNQDHNEWNTQTTVIYHTPLGSGFKAGSASDTWTINNDVPPESLIMYLAGGWRTQTSYTLSYNWNNIPSIFGEYAAAIVSGSTYKIQYGSVSNPSYLLGNYMDAKYAQIYGGNQGDGGQITVQLNSAVNSGHVYVYGYSQNGYYSHMTVLVSSNGNTWTQISDQYVYYTTGLGWIDCGAYSGSFAYVQIKGIDAYDSVNLQLDTLLVTTLP